MPNLSNSSSPFCTVHILLDVWPSSGMWLTNQWLLIRENCHSLSQKLPITNSSSAWVEALFTPPFYRLIFGLSRSYTGVVHAAERLKNISSYPTVSKRHCSLVVIHPSSLPLTLFIPLLQKLLAFGGESLI